MPGARPADPAAIGGGRGAGGCSRGRFRSRPSPSRRSPSASTSPGAGGALAARARAALRAGLEPRRLSARCTACSTPASRQRLSEAQFAAAYAHAADRPRRSISLAHRACRQPQRRLRRRCSGACSHAAVRNAARDARGAARRATARARPLRRRRCCSRGCAPASSCSRDHVTSRRAARCSPTTARRWREGPSRTSPIPTVAGEIVGTLGPIPRRPGGAVRRAGLPAQREGRDRTGSS